MNDITNQLGTMYYPKSALVFYQTKTLKAENYVEFFDLDSNGNPINAHPLTVREAKQLGKALKIHTGKNEYFLKSNGILSTNILHLDAYRFRAVWFTKEQIRTLHFNDSLGVQSGKAYVPPMVWVADRKGLSVFAVTSNRRPIEKTKLYHAPFFNIYSNGSVCMGSVDVDIKSSTSLEDFISQWESYFFNSYFSHLMEQHNPINGNCVLLWQDLVAIEKPFPKEVLKNTNRTLKDLI